MENITKDLIVEALRLVEENKCLTIVADYLKQGAWTKWGKSRGGRLHRMASDR